MSKVHSHPSGDKFIPPVHERGAALLTVLLLVSVISVISVTSLDRLTLSTKVAANSNALLQARSFAFAAETLATSQIETLLLANQSQTTLAGDWNGTEKFLPIPNGNASVRARDGGNCFNINSLVQEKENDSPLNENAVSILEQNPTGILQFVALMQLLGIAENEAQLIAASSTDWIDSDSDATALGAEDIFYLQSDTPYRAGNILMADISELRSVKDVSQAHYNILRPWLCALPQATLSPINVNTLLPEQAILLSMLLPDDLSVSAARAYLADRPISGYGSRNRFWNGDALSAITPSADVASQIQVKTQWFDIEIMVRLGSVELTEKALIDAGEVGSEPRILSRSWGHTR